MNRLIYTSVTLLFTILISNNLKADNLSVLSNNLFIYCPSDVQSFTDPGMCTAVVFFEEPSVNDSPGTIMSQTQGMPPGSDFPKGETYNLYVATDSLGNSSECGFYIFVSDVEPPQIVCRPNMTIQAEPGTNGVIVENIEPEEVWDNCQIATIEYFIDGSTSAMGTEDASGTMFNLGTSYVWYIANDTYGNSIECGFEIEVISDDLPNALCQDISVTLDEEGWVNIYPEDIDAGSSANGDVMLEIDVDQFTCMDLGTQTATLTVSDSTGAYNTCTSHVNIIDNQSPAVNCMDVTVELDSLGYAMVYPEEVGLESWDNCGIESMSLSQTEFNANDIGENEVTLFVVDLSGNTSVCNSIVTIIGETQDLYVICPESTTIPGEEMMCGAYLDGFFPDIDSSSPNVYVTYEISGATNGEGSFDVSGTAFNLGTSTVVYTISDDYGNSEVCTSEIEVIDTEGPFLEVPEGYEIAIGLDCTSELPDFTSEIESWDNCGEVLIEQFPLPGSLLQWGAHDIEFIATDESGNISFEIMTVYIYDDIDPYIECQDAILVLDSDGVGQLSPDELIINATDNCGISELFISDTSFNESHIGANEVTMTVIDMNGNMSSCTSIVTIQEHPNSDNPVIATLDFELYPNPTFGNVTIDLPHERPGVSAKVLDITGKTIYKVDFNDQSKIKLNLDEIGVGVYTISVFDQYQKMTKRLIKTK